MTGMLVLVLVVVGAIFLAEWLKKQKA